MLQAQIENKFLTIDNYCLSYWEKKNSHSEKTVIFLAGAFDKGEDVLKRYAYFIPSNYQIISFDYPGRGSSQDIQNYRIEFIADLITKAINRLNLPSPYLIGFSYGGNLIIEILKKNSIFPEGIFLVGAGECFNLLYRALFKIIIFPFRRLYFTRKYYFKLLHRYPLFRNLNEQNIVSIAFQTMEVLSYHLPHNLVLPQITGYLICLQNDKVINRKSKLKLEKIFPRTQTLQIPGGHSYNLLAKYKMTKMRINSLLQKFLQNESLL